MSFRASVGVAGSVHGSIKLAQLLSLTEWQMQERVDRLESSEIFSNLKGLGIITSQPISGARFRSKPQGWGLRAGSSVDPQSLDGQGAMARLIARAGREKFEEYFLGDKELSDSERGRLCGLTPQEARDLRDFLDGLYVREEIEGYGPAGPVPKVYSAVAGIEMEKGRPVLAFFNREIWKGLYRVHEEKRLRYLKELPKADAARVERFLKQLEFLERRKTTLYRLLESLLIAQADYLNSGDPASRRTLTQREAADKIEVSPSVLNRLISNKSLQLPWGIEAPMKSLMPSAKSLMRGRLYEMAKEKPDSSDEDLGRDMARHYGAKLSRRSVAQYRKELGLGPRGSR